MTRFVLVVAIFLLPFAVPIAICWEILLSLNLVVLNVVMPWTCLVLVLLLLDRNQRVGEEVNPLTIEMKDCLFGCIS